MTKLRSTGIAGLVALSAAFPAGAGARVLGNAPAGSGETVGIAVSGSQRAAASGGGFAWGDAGVDAGVTLLVAGLSVGFAGTARGRRGRRLPVRSA
jgi:hypothetical protein